MTTRERAERAAQMLFDYERACHEGGTTGQPYTIEMCRGLIAGEHILSRVWLAMAEREERMEAEARADEREKCTKEFKEVADSWVRFGRVGRAPGESEKK